LGNPGRIKGFSCLPSQGKRDIFLTEYAKIPDSDKRSWIRHRIARGETLSTIARKYNTSIAVLKSANHLKGNTIHAGRYLLIPVPQNQSHHYAVNQRTSSTVRRNTSANHSEVKKVIRNVPGHKKIIYEVKPGDTLGEIAEEYNTTASKIRSWNGLAYGRHIYPKQKLNIWVPENFEVIKAQVRNQIDIGDNYSGSYYVVKEGDTLWEIAQKHNLSISDLKKMNEMLGSLIKPGDRLRISKN
jgi:membrane-bound lytic murein transglycosylase D